MIAHVLTTACTILVLGAAAHATCTSPHYRKGIVWEDSRSSTLMYVSIRPSDFAPGILACLADTFTQKYGDREKTTIWIFSSRAAAKNYVPGGGDTVGRVTDWGKDLHAVYVSDKEKHEQYLEMLPFGTEYKSYGMRINLPAATIPKCPLHISERCLIAAEPIYYPTRALQQQVFGAVTLTGRIRSDGVVANVKIAETRNPNGNIELAQAALRNLRTWRFEARSSEEALRITFTFAIGSPAALEFALPGQVLIRANPISTP
jgi:TonB family protein